MPYLKLHRDEPEQPDPPAPIPFNSPDRTWRNAGTQEAAKMDTILRVEQALADVESKFDELKQHADELEDSFPLSRWLDSDDDDDGPWAA
ncbi:MAG: hypothetical protein JJ916_10320 [Phycisphaerales bacterium]|jgi:hypothetical protein|nr:hypothetical protein [Phycisphaerales bacterium]